MAVFTPRRFSGPAFASTSATSVYTVPAGRTAAFKQVVFNNTGAASATVTMHLVPNGASATTSNQVISALTIAGNSQIIWSADLPMVAGDGISVLASIANAITVTTSGIEIV